MVEDKFFLSLCIPSYNRPEGIKRALESVDAEKYASEIQIVVCEDCAPKRTEVRAVIEEFKKESKYSIKYVENVVNLGHGKNWRKCAHEADGEYLMYIGDDDMLVSGALDYYVEWLHSHDNLGYVCRAYKTMRSDGSISDNRYYNKDKFFEPGVDAYEAFFLKSNLMTGYTIKREYTYDFEDSSVDFTLYYQMYLMAEVCLRYPSGYCNIPIGLYVGDGVSYFGTNEAEKSFYKPGTNAASELSNIKKLFIVTELVDKKHSIDSTSHIKREFAKYSSYPTLLKYSRMNKGELKKCRDELKLMGVADSKYFNIYYYSLYFLGPQVCQFIISILKKIYGGRPEL